jgi:hypothetical protein
MVDRLTGVIPRKRHLLRDKLFFFVSQELVGSLVSNATNFQTIRAQR